MLAASYCVVTALLLTLLSSGAMEEQRYRTLLCSPSLLSFALVFAVTLALGFGFGSGAAVRRLIGALQRSWPP